jgi:hypothetical protein
MDLEDFVDIFNVVAHRFDGDKIFFAYQPIAHSGYDGFEDLLLSRVKLGFCFVGGGPHSGAEELQSSGGNTRRHGGSTAMDFRDSVEDFDGGRLFQDISFGACLDSAEQLVIVFEYSLHDDMDFRKIGFDEGGGLNTIYAGQIDIHEYDVRVGMSDFEKEVCGIFIDAGAGEAWCAVDQLIISIAKEVIIFEDAYFDVICHANQK